MQKTALITGGSKGIGFELARVFAKNNYNLVLISSSQKHLDDAAEKIRKEFGKSVKTIQKNLSKPGAAKKIFEQLKEEKIDVLVNNAGFGLHGAFFETDLKKEQEMMQLNIVCLVELTKYFLPQMLERKNGKILNVASTAAFQPGPLMAIYYASKAFVLHFSEAIANELKGTGVTVTALCPGPTKTGFQKRANIEKTDAAKKQMQPEKVAQIGFEGLIKGKTVVIPGTKNKALALAAKLAPRSLATEAVRKLQEKRKKQQ